MTSKETPMTRDVMQVWISQVSNYFELTGKCMVCKRPFKTGDALTRHIGTKHIRKIKK